MQYSYGNSNNNVNNYINYTVSIEYYSYIAIGTRYTHLVTRCTRFSRPQGPDSRIPWQAWLTDLANACNTNGCTGDPPLWFVRGDRRRTTVVVSEHCGGRAVRRVVGARSIK